MATPARLKKPADLWFEHNGERHRIVFVEYQDGQPNAVVTEKHWDHSRKPWFKPGRDRPTGTCAAYWDFDFCKRDGVCYYHQSGSGGDPLGVSICRFAEPDPPPGAIWHAPEVVLTRWVSKEKPEVRVRSVATLLKMGYVLLDRPLLLRGNSKRSRNPFLVAEEDETVYCERCEDHHPVGWSDPCEHIEWCHRCGWWVYGETHVRLDSHDGKPTVHDDEDD